MVLCKFLLESFDTVFDYLVESSRVVLINDYPFHFKNVKLEFFYNVLFNKVHMTFLFSKHVRESLLEQAVY